MINIKKEIQNTRDASAYQKRLKEKYPELDGRWIGIGTDFS